MPGDKSKLKKAGGKGAGRPARAGAAAADQFDLKKILGIRVGRERVERLRSLTRFDQPDLTPEAEEYLLRKFAQEANIQYARFQAGIKFTEAEVDELLDGAIDIHAHGGSENFERLLLEDDLAIEYAQLGLRAVVIKTWWTPSVSHLPLARKGVNAWCERHGRPPIQLFGGITLNTSVGGLNPHAVKRCLGFQGMKYIWMPMVDSYHHRRVVHDDWSESPWLRIVDEKTHKVLPPLKEILRIAADNDLVIACGHYPWKPDAYELMAEARRLAVRRLEMVHPTHIHSKLTIEDMKEAAREGIKLMLMGLGSCTYPFHENGPIYAVRMLKEVGPQHLVYGSDLGQIHNPSHAVVTRWFVKLLLAYGATKDEIRIVFKETAAKHIGI